jgi:allophanate hydrolase
VTVKLESLDFAALSAGYASDAFSPEQVVREVYARIARRGDDRVWIHLAPEEEASAAARALAGRDRASLPLYGLPFAIKDNIDWAGHPTTAGCPAYRYVPERSAAVVERLIAAGAIPVGKSNLDQFATGLVGTRSPYGAPSSVFDPRYISGGSSSGSAVAVAAGLVSFSLGTDTAGSGRVPAAFNNIVGLKPSRGLISNRGVVPACRSLDCVSIFALTVADALQALCAAAGYDVEDPFSRPEADRTALAWVAAPPRFRFGVPAPDRLEFFGNPHNPVLFAAARAALEGFGGTAVEIDDAPFAEAARLLYEGPWLAERYAAIGEFLRAQPEALHPVTRAIVEQGARPSAVEAFQAYYRLKALRRAAARIWAEVDALLLPTAGTAYTLAEVEAEPLRLNANLGRYTNFVNLLDLCGVAVPAGFTPDGLPFGVTLLAPAFREAPLAALADALHRRAGVPLGATGQPLPPPAATSEDAPPGWVRLCVIGAHMAGLPLSRQLTGRGGRFVREARTAAQYRLFALAHLDPPRPGMVRVAEGGGSVALEVWELPEAEFGGFVAAIPPPLGIGTVALAGGEQVKGFLAEPYVLAQGEDITALGGWRAYLARRAP